MSSECIIEHLTDCGVVGIHVFAGTVARDPLLGHGLLIELNVRLREEVVLGREGFVSRPHLLGEVHKGLTT